MFFKFFLQFQPPGTAALWSYSNAATFLAKMLLVFGVSFQVPVIAIFLHKIGAVSRNVMIDYWRHVVVLIFILVAVITPTWDPFTLGAAAAPPCLLYVLSIWLVKWL
jgi:sec-independent protein translocase protein TatC